MSNHKSGTILWALFIILIGILLLFNNLDFLDFGDLLRDYWPVLIILLGIYLLFEREHFHFGHNIAGDKNISSEDSIIEYSNVFGDMKIDIDSPNFEKGKINNTFGDILLGLEKINITSGEKILDVHGVFGGIKISLKRDFPVYIRANVVAGDIVIIDQKVDGFSKELTYKSDTYDSADKKLKIYISHTFGDIKVW